MTSDTQPSPSKRTLITVTRPDSVPFAEGSGTPDAVRLIWDAAVSELDACSGVMLYMLLSGATDLWLHTDPSQNESFGLPPGNGIVTVSTMGLTPHVLETVVGLTKYLFNAPDVGGSQRLRRKPRGEMLLVNQWPSSADE